MAPTAATLTPSFERLLRHGEGGLSEKARTWTDSTDEYQKITNTYFWASSKLETPPLLVFQPATASDVQLFLSAWKGPFAVKAASHIAPRGFNDTDEAGILVDMSLMTETTWYPDSKTIDVGPGLKWTDIYDFFERENIPYNVTGATSCQGVGVAGFLLGGGYGNKTNNYGLAMDCIKSIEVVLPTGEIVNARHDGDKREKILFWGLRGGGNNFGIVTKWTLYAHPQPKDIFLKRFVYEKQYWPQVQEAIMAFIEKAKDHRKAFLETKFEWTVEHGDKAQKPTAIAECYYDGQPPLGFFREFQNIPHHVKPQEASTWPELVKLMPKRNQTMRWGVIEGKEDLAYLGEIRGRYTCVMLSHYTAKFLQMAIEIVEQYAHLLPTHSGVDYYPSIEPYNAHIFDKSLPSAWPRQTDKANFALPIRCRWTNAKFDDFWLDQLREITTLVRLAALAEGCTTRETPVYYNLTLDGTPVEQIYRENLADLEQLRKAVDPENVMGRTGGFRIKRAGEQ